LPLPVSSWEKKKIKQKKGRGGRGRGARNKVSAAALMEPASRIQCPWRATPVFGSMLNGPFLEAF